MSSETEISTASPNQDLVPSILDLNDDCLLNILGNLDEIDLCAVDETCQRLRQLSEYYFHKWYSCKPFLFPTPKENDPRKFFEVKRILVHFGKYINKLLIAHSGDLELIGSGTYCNQHLHELELNDIYLHRHNLSDCQVLLSNVKRLSLKQCRGKEKNFARFLDSCNSLKELEISEIYNYCGIFLANKFGQLESIIFKKITSVSSNYVTIFFSKNFNLKKIHLIDCRFTSDDIFGKIAVYLKNIEEISIQVKNVTNSFEKNLTKLSKLPKLKRLEFNCAGHQITSAVYSLASKNTMEHFSISDTKLNKDLCVALSKMKSLKTLKLISMQDECRNFAKLLSSNNLINLEQLYIVNSNMFTFKNTLDIVEGVPNLMRLVIKSCDKFSIVIPNEFLRLVQARRKWYSARFLTIYLDQSKLNAMKETITEGLLKENSEYIKLLSTLRPEIQNEDLICDCDDDDEWTDVEIEIGVGEEDEDNDSY